MAPLDAGDIAHKDKFEKQLRFPERSPEYCMIGSWANLIDHKRRVNLREIHVYYDNEKNQSSRERNSIVNINF